MYRYSNLLTRLSALDEVKSLTCNEPSKDLIAFTYVENSASIRITLNTLATSIHSIKYNCSKESYNPRIDSLPSPLLLPYQKIERILQQTNRAYQVVLPSHNRLQLETFEFRVVQLQECFAECDHPVPFELHVEYATHLDGCPGSLRTLFVNEHPPFSVPLWKLADYDYTCQNDGTLIKNHRERIHTLCDKLTTPLNQPKRFHNLLYKGG